MPRNIKRKSDIGLTDENVMKTAVASVLNGGLAAKAAAARYNIPRTTLRRYLQNCRDANIIGTIQHSQESDLITSAVKFLLSKRRRNYLNI